MCTTSLAEPLGLDWSEEKDVSDTVKVEKVRQRRRPRRGPPSPSRIARRPSSQVQERVRESAGQEESMWWEGKVIGDQEIFTDGEHMTSVLLIPSTLLRTQCTQHKRGDKTDDHTGTRGATVFTLFTLNLSPLVYYLDNKM